MDWLAFSVLCIPRKYYTFELFGSKLYVVKNIEPPRFICMVQDLQKYKEFLLVCRVISV